MVGFISACVNVVLHEQKLLDACFGGPTVASALRSHCSVFTLPHTLAMPRGGQEILGSINIALTHFCARHRDAINALHVVSETVLATGDDSGTVKLWDLRTRGCVVEYEEHADFISGLATSEHRPDTLVASSGDGTLSVMEWRKKDGIELSYQLEDEPLCLAIVKGGSKVVCGTQEGTLGIYAWGAWEDVQDRMLGHPTSVDTITKLSEDTVCVCVRACVVCVACVYVCVCV